MGARLMAIVAEGERGRVYLAPTPEMEAISPDGEAQGWKPEVDHARQGARLPRRATTD